MKNLLFILSLCLIGTQQGCGGDGSSSVHFNSVSGTWEIDAQKIISANCPVRVGGFSGIITVTTNGNVVSASVFGTDTPFTGTVTADGFLIEASSSSQEDGQVKYIITVSGIPQVGNNESGESSYSYQSVFNDGSVACEFTATGSAKHLSD